MGSGIYIVRDDAALPKKWGMGTSMGGRVCSSSSVAGYSGGSDWTRDVKSEALHRSLDVGTTAGDTSKKGASKLRAREMLPRVRCKSYNS